MSISRVIDSLRLADLSDNPENTQHYITSVLEIQQMMDKRDRADLFRPRLDEAITRAGLNQSALARRVGVDRSTISALLARGTRLPNAQLVGDCAQALAVSSDWLLGLTDRSDPPDTLLDRALQTVPTGRALFDATMFGWHQSAAGYKIRHVPATLPDILKTRTVVMWEYMAALGTDADQAYAGFTAQLDLLRTTQSDFEIAMPLDGLTSFASATGYWQGIPLATRLEQIDHLIALCDELYPVLRVYLFDAHKVFSAPITVFGPHLAAIYLGQAYLAFHDRAKVAEVSQHFDWLVREAAFSARDAAGHFRTLRDQVI